MKKFTKIIASVTALILTLGIVGCGSKSTDYPAFKPGSGFVEEETSEKYTVNVHSAGGLKLDGVRVSAYNASGTKVRSGISKDGVINFNLSLGDYSLVVDEETLPAGYYLEEGVSYSTNPEKREDIDISIPSKVISQAATSDKLYSLGEIINDFTLKDYRSDDEGYTGTRNYKFSDILKQKKAIVLNFWYPTCTFCTQEFPFLQAAYSAAKNDVEVIGVCFSGYTNKNVADYVEKYKKDFTLTFPLCVDTVGIQKRFNIESAPTTIVIDRYGMIAFWESGGQPSVAFWQELFKKYASDNYVQDVNGTGGTGSEEGGSSADREIPDVKMPSSMEMAEAASANGLNASYRADTEDVYAWPWTTTTDETFGNVITVTNTGKQNSYAILYVDIVLKKDDLLSFDYFVSSEEGRDILYVFLDGQLINGDGWSGTENGWTSYDCYVADRDKTVELSFVFQKDEGDPSAEAVGQDCAKIKNIHTSTVSSDTPALDVIREAASGTFKEGKYEHYVDVVLGSDGFYHVGSADGPLLYISLTNITPWSEQHTENNHFEHDGASDYATLYYMTYFMFAETIESEDGNSVVSFTVKIGDKDFSTALQSYNHMLDMLEKPYQLMPVSVQLREWAEAFVNAYEGADAHENEWLEFCFYYDHYGMAHEDGEDCLRDTDITEGLTIFNPYEITFGSTPASGDKTEMITGQVKYPLTRPNGLYYEFTAPKDGVYQIRDYEGNLPDLTIFKMSDDGLNSIFIDYCTGVQDFDVVVPILDENNNPILDEDGNYASRYSSFNKYLTLAEGETVYLLLYIEEQTTGSFTFDITYYESVDKLMHCSTNGGAWTYDENNVFIYLGIKAAYDSATDRYYYANDDGTPDHSKPVYINMVYMSYFMSELNGMNYASVETLINNNIFATISSTAQADMFEYLKQAKAKDVNDELYGLVEADQNIVSILNSLISKNGGAGDNRGWMCFACYMEHLTYSAN
ncbi:MAG: peroxiredoxin family protein [Candidatus Coproplasma sp.]